MELCVKLLFGFANVLSQSLLICHALSSSPGAAFNFLLIPFYEALSLAATFTPTNIVNTILRPYPLQNGRRELSGELGALISSFLVSLSVEMNIKCREHLLDL
jgi:hypothetical protein